MTAIAEAETLDKDGNIEIMQVIRKEDGLYDVQYNGVVRQPNHDAEGIIRYLTHCLNGVNYRLSKSLKTQAK